jgi:protein-S-isoprenylcysteine O-methyltransferase Ste14
LALGGPALLLAFAAVYLCAALALLRQWNSPQPWARLDVFSGGYLVLILFWLYDQHRWHKVVFRSKELLNEAAGMSYDPLLVRWSTVLALAELAVFRDYGHWRLAPWLEQPWLQWTGLALAAAGGVWLHWTDAHLVPHFAGDLSARRVITSGPYRFVRHPRYAGLLVSRLAFALTYASPLAWALGLVWAALVARRIPREEAHLRRLFGADYEAYAARTARLIPGVY